MERRGKKQNEKCLLNFHRKQCGMKRKQVCKGGDRNNNKMLDMFCYKKKN